MVVLQSNGGTGAPATIAPAPVTTILWTCRGSSRGAYFAADGGEPRV